MNFHLHSCSPENGLWKAVQKEWHQQCEDYEEDVDNYASASMPVLQALSETPTRRAKVFVLLDEGHKPHAVFQANSARLPGFEGFVLRIRHLVLSPEYDYGKHEIEDYKTLLASCFGHACELARTSMQSDHVKFHFRTSADLYFFKAAYPSLLEEPAFKDVIMYGAWLSLGLNSTPQLVVSK